MSSEYDRGYNDGWAAAMNQVSGVFKSGERKPFRKELKNEFRRGFSYGRR